MPTSDTLSDLRQMTSRLLNNELSQVKIAAAAFIIISVTAAQKSHCRCKVNPFFSFTVKALSQKSTSERGKVFEPA